MMSCFSKSKYSCKYYTETPGCWVSVFYERYFVDKENVFRKIRAGVRTINTHTKVWLRQRWGQVAITQHVRWREANVKVHTVSKAGEGVRRPRKNKALERKNGKVNNTSGFNLCSCHSGHSVHKLLCQTCRRCSGASVLAAGCQHKIMQRPAAILSEDSKESELVADPSWKAPVLVVFLDGRRIRLPNQSASLDEKKAGAAAQV